MRCLKVFLPLGLLVPLLTGCNNTSNRSYLGTAVWSDDDQEHAYTHLQYEVENQTWPYPVQGAENRTNRRHSLYVQNPDGTNQRAIYTNRENLGERIYYMKTSGYFVVEVQTSSGYGPVRADKVSLSGNAVTIATGDRAGACGHFEAVPSPDGTMIAIMQSTSLQSANDTASYCAGLQINLRLLDAVTLAQLDEYDLNLNTGAHVGLGLTWTVDNEVVVGDSGIYYRVNPGSSVTIDDPECTGPMTTSSFISSDGMMIGPGYNGNGDPVVNNLGIDTSPGSSFSCNTPAPTIDWSTLNGTQPSTPKPIIDFTALNYDGSLRGQSDLVGQPTLLWFFTMASTSGDTVEAAGFRDLYESFSQLDVQIVGASFDNPSQLTIWVNNEQYQYEIWQDVDRTLAQYYGAASNADAFFANRMSVLLDETGAVLLEYLSPNVSDHPLKALEDCQALFGD